VKLHEAALLAALSLGIAGCSIPERGVAVPQGYTERALPLGLANARFFADADPRAMTEEGMRSVEREQAILRTAGTPANRLPPVTYLAVSGGGDNGAFGAGLLNGWTQTGTRPEFKMVTGVSTGALIAPFAFLGPDYDPVLRELYTSMTPEKVYVARGLRAALFDDAMADTSPLAEIISRYADQKMLDAIAREYQKGRLLMIGTTDLDAQRPVIWNMGEIAASPHPYAVELFQQVLLASASIPGAFPPVHIKVRVGDQILEEMHVDGGPTRQVFVAPANLSLRTFDKLYPKPPIRRIYVVKNGKLAPEYEAVQANTLAISARSLFTVTKSQSIGDINRIYATAERDDAEFRLAAIPASFAVKATEVFDPAYMKELYQVGYEMGRTGDPWMMTPPETAETTARR